jgi:maltooligosyltrehalose trehalohydrolase
MSGWLTSLVREGRKEFMKQWRSMRNQPMLDSLADPVSPDTFARCKINHSELGRHTEAYQLHCDLIRLRRTDPVLSACPPAGLDGAVLSSSAFLLRYFGQDGNDRLLLVNLGADLRLNPAPEPLLAPLEGHSWSILLSTEAPQYGGSGALEPDAEERGWCIAGQAAVLLGPGPLRASPEEKKEKAFE